MIYARATLLAVTLLALSGCGSSPLPRPSARPFDDVRRLTIVASGASVFTLVEHRSEPGRTIDEVLAWHPYGAMLRPLATLMHRGISSVLKADREVLAARGIDGVTPRSVVAMAMVRTLQASGSFNEIGMLEQEEWIGGGRGPGDAHVRVTVPSWGLIRVRDGDPHLLSSFAEVGGHMTVPGTGIVVWEHREDVTGPDQAPLESFTKNPSFVRQEMMSVLDRAGQRLANELLYARSAGP